MKSIEFLKILPNKTSTLTENGFDGPTTIMAGNGIINEKLLNKISENIVES